MRVDSTYGKHTALRGIRQAVYDGRDRVGDVLEQDGKFVVRNRRGDVVGEFTSLREATRSLDGGVS
jgi:hypothetical protein